MRNKLDREHILSICEPGDYGIFAPPMKAQVAVHELCRYFLGEDWYVVDPLPNMQVNPIIVYEIERKYRKRSKH